jgi:hypothetical protein
MTHQNRSLNVHSCDTACAYEVNDTLVRIETLIGRVLNRIAAKATLTNVGGPFYGKTFRLRSASDTGDIFVQIMSTLPEGDLRLENEIKLEDLFAESNNRYAKTSYVKQVAAKRWISKIIGDERYADLVHEAITEQLEVWLTQALELALVPPVAS